MRAKSIFISLLITLAVFYPTSLVVSLEQSIESSVTLETQSQPDFVFLNQSVNKIDDYDMNIKQYEFDQRIHTYQNVSQSENQVSRIIKKILSLSLVSFEF